MANNNHQYGFRWVRSLHGGNSPEPLRYRIASGYRPTLTVSAGANYVDLSPGDPCVIASDGTIQICAGIESDTPATAPWGIVVGFMPLYDSSLGRMAPKGFYPNAGITYGSVYDRESFALVIPAYGNVWEIDVDDNTTATTYASYRAYVGENVNHILDYADSDAKADPRVDISAHATTNTFRWRILDISPSAENADFSGTNVKVYVTPNVSQEPPFTVLGV